MLSVKIEDIIEQIPIKPQFKLKYSEAYLLLFDYLEVNFKNTRSYKQSTVNKLNYLIYHLYTEGTVPYNWEDIVQDSDFYYDEDTSKVVSVVVPCFLDVVDIDWSYLINKQYVNISLPEKEESKSSSSMVGTFEVKHTGESTDSTGEPSEISSSENVYPSIEELGNDVLDVEDKIDASTDSSDDEYDVEVPASDTAEVTDKEDLFIVTPKYPKVGEFDPKYGNIHISLPQVPTKQCEVSCTTRVESMSDEDLLNLYPKNFIRTRSPLMYQPKEGITLDPDFGLLIPVDGFTDAQVRDCIIRYPHIFKLKRKGPDGSVQSFYNHIEIDGELIDTLEAWNFLPEAKIFDFDSMETRHEQVEFMKEYAIRRYLLERDVKGIKHKYDVVGDLPEFITLFMPSYMYESEGYGDPVELARTCVQARVSYLSSRNPRIGQNPTVKSCVFDSYCTNSLCDRSCPSWAQMDYLMMRNGLTDNSRPFKMKSASLQRYIDAYERYPGKLTVIVSSDPIRCAEIMSYISVCNNWNGSAMRVRSYHLLFSQYIDSMQSSWNNKSSRDFEYVELWSKSCNTLVVSSIDYVNFKDYQSQVLLQLIQDRERQGKTTIVVTPRLENLTGSGNMFNLLVSKLRMHTYSIF